MFCQFSKAERIDYARRLERIECLKAEKRMKAGKSDLMEIFPQGIKIKIGGWYFLLNVDE